MLGTALGLGSSNGALSEVQMLQVPGRAGYGRQRYEPPGAERALVLSGTDQVFFDGGLLVVTCIISYILIYNNI
jgi:hypothetical protein